MTRRGLLAAAPLLALRAREAFAVNPFHRRRIVASPFHAVYIGCDTGKGRSKGIYRASFRSDTGHLAEPMLVAETPNPSFFAFGPETRAGRFLYACNETSSNSFVTAFAMEAHTGGLREVGRSPVPFAGPCHIAVDATGRAVFVASYSGGGVSSFRVEPAGTLSQAVEHVDFHNTEIFGAHGPNGERQDGPHPHCVTLSPDNRFLIVDDLGDDSSTIFGVDAGTAQMHLGSNHLFRNGRPGSGPRHVAFHPNGRWLYSVNELDSTVDHYLWTTTHSQQSAQALLVDTHTSVKTLPADFPPERKNTAAEIALSADGFHLYVSNRGDDSLVVFNVKQDSGALETVQRIGCGGKTPRQFTLDPTGEWLLCGNQDSGSVTVFRRDGASGQLAGPVQTVAIDGPQCCLFS